jgi:hypothetical protein
MAEYPTMEQQADPNYVWPLEYAAPQDRGEPAPAANPAPGVNSVTEPATETKEFVDTSANLADITDHEDSAKFTGVDRTGRSEGVRVDAPASKGGGTELPKKK